MQYIHGLELNLENINEILKIAQEEGYIKSLEAFRFNEKNHKFEFHILTPRHNIILDMDRFIEFYTTVLKR